MEKIYFVRVVHIPHFCLGEFVSLDEAKKACLNYFLDSDFSYIDYVIFVYNKLKKRYTRCHFSRCSYYHLCDSDFPQFCLDYGK